MRNNKSYRWYLTSFRVEEARGNGMQGSSIEGLCSMGGNGNWRWGDGAMEHGLLFLIPGPCQQEGRAEPPK